MRCRQCASIIVSTCAPPPKSLSLDDEKPAVPLRVITHCDTLMLAEATDYGAFDVDGMLVDVKLLDLPLIEPAHDILIAYQVIALEDYAEGTLQCHPPFQSAILRMTSS
jgi:hypothetical protein